ncbi:MAG: DNA methylase [Chrysiogenetes bacterium]|nr:DNA methylase [Chrysiogenetes bacterium]
MTIESRFDISFVANLALREKQIQQNYRPIIAVHKWFARRPGSLFRALMLSEFGDRPLRQLYFAANDYPHRRIADPFMGGGTPLIEANRVGADVVGFDINPMAAWIVREEIEHLDILAYRAEAERLIDTLRHELEKLYVTDCPIYCDKDVPVKYFLWVKTILCENCGQNVDLFPGYLISENSRHPLNVLVCPDCGELNEVADKKKLGACHACGTELRIEGPAKRGRCVCSNCHHENRYPRPGEGALAHRLFAIEYYNPHRKTSHNGRFFKKPDRKDLQRIKEAQQRWNNLAADFVPDQVILSGDETDRLHRWGYSHYREMFSFRQLLGLELSCRLISTVKDERIRHALATNLSDLLRYQNLLCRYDTWALKSLDIFSVHGFPVGLVQCESNLLGIVNGKGANVGSGGWTNIVDKYAEAKAYCDSPFEVRQQGQRKVRVPIAGEWIGEYLNGARPRSIDIHCADATSIELAPQSLDAVFTDPPYFGNVQYGELMDFCYVWLRRLVGDAAEGFWRPSSRADEELTGNVTKSRGLPQFAEGLARVYTHMAKALKPGAPLAFTYHHNKLDAYYAVGIAILDAGLTCSASLPCPAEMGGSIHIHGTTSSIVDTVFVCRSTGSTRKKWFFEDAEGLATVVADDLAQLTEAGRRPSTGDIRCIVYGHLTRMTIWKLRQFWDDSLLTEKKLEIFAEASQKLADPNQTISLLDGRPSFESAGPLFSTHKSERSAHDAVPF